MQKTENLRTTTDWPCGQTIVMVRTMTDSEMKAEGWERYHGTSINPTCFVLSDGAIIYPSRDTEGNGPGEFFGKAHDDHFWIGLSQA